MGNARNLADLLGTSTKANQVISTSGNISTTGDLTIDSGTLFVDASENKVGIGTTTVRNNLDFGVTSNNDPVIALRDNNTSRTILGLTNGYGVRVGSPHDGTNTENMFEIGEIAGDGTTYQNTHFGVTYGGNATINNGNLVIGTSGKGIDFSATSDGSGAKQAEVLDDYEEGTWTPTLTSGGTISTLHAAVNTKIGNKIRVGTYMALSSIPNNSSAFYIAGLPFNVSYTAGGANDHYHGAGSVTYVGSHDVLGFGMLPPTPYTGQASMYFHRGDGSSATVRNSDVTGMSHIIVATSYMTA